MKRIPFRQLNDSFWTSPEWRSLPPGRPNARALLMWLAVGPAQRRSVMGVPVPGVLIIGDGEIAEHLGWKPREVSKLMRELAEVGAVEQDRAANLVWLPWKFQHEPPANASVVMGWRTAFEQWPKGELAERVRQQLRSYLQKPDKDGLVKDGLVSEYDKLPGNNTEASAPPPPTVSPHSGVTPSPLTVLGDGEGTHQGALSIEHGTASSEEKNLVAEKGSAGGRTPQPVKAVNPESEDVTRFLPASLREKLLPTGGTP